MWFNLVVLEGRGSGANERNRQIKPQKFPARSPDKLSNLISLQEMVVGKTATFVQADFLEKSTG